MILAETSLGLVSSLRVIHTISSLRKSAGGPSRTVTSLCRELGESGAQVDLVSRDFHTEGYDSNLIPSSKWVTTTLVPTRSGFFLERFWASAFRAALLVRCGRGRSLVIHDHGLWLPTNHTAANVARDSRVPLIISTRGMLEPWALGLSRLEEALSLASLPAA